MTEQELVRSIRAKYPSASTRLINICRSAKYQSLEDMAKTPEAELSRLYNFGAHARTELRQLTGGETLEDRLRDFTTRELLTEVLRRTP